MIQLERLTKTFGSKTAVDDITATLARVKERGGTIRYPRFEVPGRVVLAVFKDPAGNSVGLVELENGKAKVPPAPKP